MLKLYRGDDEILTVIDNETLDDTNYFSATEEPNYLRFYSDGKPYGELLSKHTGLEGDLPADEWMYNSTDGEILLGQNRTGTAITYDGTIFLFEAEAIAGSGSGAERTLTATVTVANEYTDLKCVNVNLSAVEYFSDATVSPTIVSMSIDDVSYSNTLSIAEILPGSSQDIYVKIEMPEGTSTMNYRNLGIQKDYRTEFNE